MSQRRILFFLLHPGYLRQYLPVIEELDRRGDTVIAALSEPARSDADRALIARLPGKVRVDVAPRRSRRDGWASIALAIRGVADAGRYTDPRYKDAAKLRARGTFKVQARLRSDGYYDPVTRRVLLKIVSLLHRQSSAKVAAITRRVTARLESAIPSSSQVERYIRAASPDVVVVTPLVEFASSQVDYLKSARKLGIATVAAIASWDNLTNKGLLRFIPDRVVVWNEAQRGEAAALHDIPHNRVAVAGAQRFDGWFARSPSLDREEFVRAAGLDPQQPYILYVASSAFIAPNEVPSVKRWLEHLRQDPALARVGVMVRAHPKHAEPWQDVDLSPFGDAVVWPRSASEPDAGAARDTFYDSLAHAGAIVGVNTSVLLEAAILRKPVLALVTGDFEETQLGTLHFRHLLEENGGFVQVGRTLEQHVEQLRASLADSQLRGDETRAFVARFLRPNGIELAATPFVADAIERAEPAQDREHRSLLRFGLLPFAAVSALAAMLARRREEASEDDE